MEQQINIAIIDRDNCIRNHSKHSSCKTLVNNINHRSHSNIKKPYHIYCPAYLVTCIYDGNRERFSNIDQSFFCIQR
jgi:hypothetical protein